MSFHHGGVNVQVGNEHELVNETSRTGGRTGGRGGARSGGSERASGAGALAACVIISAS